VSRRPRFLGIAGPSCSGKSSLARYLAIHLPDGGAVLSLDAYYRDRADLEPETRARLNFDDPEALDLELLDLHLERLAAGAAADRPLYNFATHRREPRTEILAPRAWVVVEGLFALHWEGIRRRYLAAVFVEATEGVCFSRRLARDTTERGRSPDSVRAQFEAQVGPMTRRYVLPDRRYADLVVDGSVPIETIGAAVLAFLDSPPALLSGAGAEPPLTDERRAPC
jgi:uridine kinase